MSDDPDLTSSESYSKAKSNMHNSLNQSSISTFNPAKQTAQSLLQGIELNSIARNQVSSAQSLMSIQQADYLEKSFAQKSSLSDQHLEELTTAEVTAVCSNNRNGSFPSIKVSWKSITRLSGSWRL
jgi:hypothetical protein